MSDPRAGGVTSGRLVRLEQIEDVLWLTLDRPPLNVLDISMLGALADSIDVARQSAARVLVLTGAGKAFCAGVDVADHTADRVARTLELFHHAIRGLLAAPMPVVAAVNGHALGGGCELALACDLVFAHERALLGQPEIQLGVFPPAAAALLPRLIGAQRALDLILTGRTVTAAEALTTGLVARVLSAETFRADLEVAVGRLAAHSGPVLRLAKRATRLGMSGDAGEAIGRAERLYLDELMQLRDPHEGIAAFMEKRRPVWSGA